MSLHAPVLLHEVADAISPMSGGTYADFTFGRGGYSAEWLRRAPCTIYALDRDPDAIAAGQELASTHAGLNMVPGRFGDAMELLGAAGAPPLDGIAMDLGVSSPQLDEAARGFSFQADGPLDMRMSRSGPTAADLVNNEPEDALANTIYRLGEERLSRRIAKAIVTRRADKPFTTTLDLADCVTGAMPGSARRQKIHPATRTFQALRLAVNDELGELERGLIAAEHLLAPGGRLAVVSFHSLEDRITKLFLRDRSGGVGQSRHMPDVAPAQAATFKLVKKGAIKAGADEIDANPRARSARLRVAIRTEAPAWPVQEVA